VRFELGYVKSVENWGENTLDSIVDPKI